MNKFRQYLIIWALVALGVSICLTKFFWCAFGHCTIAKEAFGIFGVWITIFGFWIGIDQIVRLRREKQIIHDTKISERLKDVHTYLDEVIANFSSGIDIYAIRDCIHIFKKIRDKITAIKIEGCDTLDCDEFNKNINDIIQEFGAIIQDQDLIKRFSNTVYEVRTNDLKNAIIKVETNLAKD